ncbi:hypothetical protein UlMin_041259 [Ulmus minor]
MVTWFHSFIKAAVSDRLIILNFQTVTPKPFINNQPPIQIQFHSVILQTFDFLFFFTKSQIEEFRSSIHVENSIQTSMLASFLPTGTLLTLSTQMIHFLLTLFTLSCVFFFYFTDSSKASIGKVEVPKEDRNKLGLTDFAHAVMSVLVFKAIAMSDHHVTGCLFPGHVKETDQVMECLPLMVGIVCSGLILVFPNTRYGVGCMPI